MTSIGTDVDLRYVADPGPNGGIVSQQPHGQEDFQLLGAARPERCTVRLTGRTAARDGAVSFEMPVRQRVPPAQLAYGRRLYRRMGQAADGVWEYRARLLGYRFRALFGPTQRPEVDRRLG